MFGSTTQERTASNNTRRLLEGRRRPRHGRLKDDEGRHRRIVEVTNVGPYAVADMRE